MRIGFNFHTADEFISGVEYYSLTLLKSLLSVNGGHEYVVFTNRPGLVRRYVGEARNLEVRGVGLKTRGQRIAWEHAVLPKAAEAERVDVLHCPHYICPARRGRVPYVTTIHDTIAVDRPEWCKRLNALYYGLAMGRTVETSTRVISVSGNTADDIRRNFGANGEKVRTVYSGIDPIFTNGTNAAEEERVGRLYSLPERYILYVGNIEPKKNVGGLLRAYKLLKERGVEHKLVLAGRRTWRSEGVWRAIRENFREGDVVVAGYVEREDLPAVYRMAEVLAFVSLYEGFGFPPLEAMACGTAVVSSTRGALAETIGASALVAEPEDVEQIAGGIYSLICDDELRRRHVGLGLREVRRFCPVRSAQETLKVYEEAAR
jgi:glycosyltransferase involved in cell wall biosynthesis